MFHDINGDLHRAATGEEGLAGQTLWLDLDGDNALDANEPSVVTNRLGRFRFTQQAGGSYTIRLMHGMVQLGSGLNVTIDDTQVSSYGPLVGWMRTSPTTSYRVNLDPGDARGGRDWGLQQPVSISGTVFRDVNRDGKMSDDAETPLSGWRVYLDMNNDAKPATDGSEPIIDTGEKGTFEFTNLRPGTENGQAMAPT